MATLKIALLGVSSPGVSQLGATLEGAVKASGWPVHLQVLTPAFALPAELASCALVLLMGLESAATTAVDLAQEAADQSLRAALADTLVAYRVLYGTPEARLAHALRAIESLLPTSVFKDKNIPRGDTQEGKNRPWVWMCDKCSDPGCEHRLLTALLDQRARPA